MSATSPITSEGRIRRSALFMLLALAAETLTMYWRHPLSFYLFAIAGGILGLLGTVSFLLSFVSHRAQPDSWASVVDSFEEERRAARS